MVTMLPQQQQAILTIALLAAFSDDAKDDRERDEIKRIAVSLGGEAGSLSLAQVYQDVLLKRVNVDQATHDLTDSEHKQLAYEMAVCVCDADGALNVAERAFLRELKSALGLDDAQTAHIEHEASALASMPIDTPVSGATANVPEGELDRYILNHAIMNGALELLPQSLASMAIIPLQVKLVYRVGKAFGHELDHGHIKEFIATVGVGLTSQYVEQIGRKLMGGLLGAVAGGLGRGLGRATTGVAFSFATTYALGHLAKRYYAGGRQMSTALLQETYQSLLSEARNVQGRYSSDIQQKAATIDVSQIVSMVKGL